MKKSIIAVSLLTLGSTSALAADYSDGDVYKNNYKWMQANLMYSVDEMPRIKGADENGHDYLELEFGGRAGVLDYYGYVDVFNLTNTDKSDKADGASKMFMKFAPRVSLDGLFQTNLSMGPVKELYLATLFNWGGGAIDTQGDGGGDVNNAFVGLGSDMMVPWLGKIGFNVYGLYDVNNKDWNGYQVSTNWFKPFYTFENGSFFSYQGYIDYQFGMKDEYSTASSGGVMYNGLYWHTDHFSVGYGLKAYQDVYGLKDGSDFGEGEFETTGVSHYFAATYKF